MTNDQSAEQLLELAAKAGAQAAEVFQSRSQSRPVFFEANRLKQLESIESEGTGLRLWLNDRPGLAVAYGPVEPQALIDRAIALSELGVPESIELSTGTQTSYPDLGESVEVEQLIIWGKDAIATIREAYPEILCMAEWDCEVESTRLLNSLGLDYSYQDTTLSGYLGAEWVRGDDFLNVSDGETQRGKLNPIDIAQRILQRLHWAKENVASPSGKLPVLFTAKAADLLWGTVSAALNGKLVLEGASPWSDRLGEQVTSTLLTLSQEPDIGPYSCPFDDEGTSTRPIVFIQKGVLQLFYTDRTTGKTLGSGTTGNGFRPGLGSYPTPGLFNELIKPGDKNFAELIAQLDNGIIVDQMLGGTAGISGEFSINVELGYLVKNGQIVGRIKDTMVAGNVYTAIKNLVELGSDAEWNGSCYTPSVIVEGLSVTGKC
ncbi:peptidase C69 [Oscillatoriales cyanobacterium USR001]|nr:peptidase C69 [Oscillatoriales cyanobacterium USR001]